MPKQQHRSKALSCYLALLLACGAVGSPLWAGDIIWTNTAGDWDVAGNWSPNQIPSDGDDVYITNAGASVRISGASSNLNSLTLDKTLIFTNWAAALVASNVTVFAGGVVTCDGGFTNSQMSNRVYIVCTNLDVAAGGSINVNGKGYAGGQAAGQAGSGVGGGGAALVGGGGGHGGRGGTAYGAGGTTYGQYDAPESPGSGGGYSTDVAGGIGAAGGGAIRIDAAEIVRVDGTISAIGGTPGGTYTGAGSGGSIYITCRAITGDGSLSAAGGTPTSGNAGGGGRIAVIYNFAAQAATNMPGGIFTTAGPMRGRSDMGDGDVGTLYFPDNAFLRETFVHSGHWLVPSFTNWAPTNCYISNGWLRLTQAGFQLRVTNALTVRGTNYYLNKLELNSDLVTCGSDLLVSNAVFRMTNSTGTRTVMSCGGSLAVANNGYLYVGASMTNATVPDYGGLVSVTGNIFVANGGRLYSVAMYMTNGGVHLFRMSNLIVAAGGILSADGQGYSGGIVGHTTGYGAGGGGNGTLGGGGGHGGRGGCATDYPAIPGSTNGPLSPTLSAGSGGGYSSDINGGRGGGGGGSLKIEAVDAVQVDGTLSANGAAGGYFSGCGAGGGLHVQCRTYSGSGTLSADGVSGQAPSGGGRIALIYDPVAQAATNRPTGAITALAGGSTRAGGISGDIGSLYFPDVQLFGGGLRFVGQWFCASGVSWNASGLLLTNSWLRLPQQELQLSVTGDVVMTGSSKLEIGGDAYLGSASRYALYNCGTLPAVFSVGGSMSLATGCTVSLYAAQTNAPTPDYGLLLNIGADLIISSNAWLYPITQLTNGGSPLLRVGNLNVNTGGHIHADGLGFGATKGPGAGGSAGGGGYGGQGGGATGGAPYGSADAPVYAGSGGGAGSGGAGGGLIRVEAGGTIRLDGIMSATGTSVAAASSGGGAGGGIYLRCRKFEGGGQLQAPGGNAAGSSSGGGGGGRIAVWRSTGGTVATNVDGGTGTSAAGMPGTVVWGLLAYPGTIINYY